MRWHELAHPQGGDGEALDDDTKSEHSENELGASGGGSGSDDVFLRVSMTVCMMIMFISIYSTLPEGAAELEVAGFVQEVQ